MTTTGAAGAAKPRAKWPWSRRGRAMTVYLAEGYMATAADAGGVEAQHVQGLDEALSVLEQRLQASAGAGLLDVRLSACLAPPFLLGPIPGLKAWPEVLSVARNYAAETLGLPHDCDVWVDDWPDHRPVLGAAVDSGIQARLHALAAKAGSRLWSLRPWWSDALNRVLADEPKADWLLLDEPDGVALFSGVLGAVPATAGAWPARDEEQQAAVAMRARLSSGCSGLGLRARSPWWGGAAGASGTERFAAAAGAGAIPLQWEACS